MGRILFVNACPRPGSRTLELARELLEKLPGEVQEVRLFELGLTPLDPAGLAERDRAGRSGDYSDPAFDLARQFAQADSVVIAAPYWDLMFPGALKLYLERITVSGLTFAYSEKGIPQSLCRAQALYYVTTSGGYIGQNDFGFSYVKALAVSFFGISDVHRFAAEGLDIFGNDVAAIMARAKADMHSTVEQRQSAPCLPRRGYGGAAAFDGCADHPLSRYYVANDYFRMQSDATLHILHNFRTYQQTEEYTCGAASALMVLNWFGREKYHEQAVAQLLETHCTKGSSVEGIADLFDLIGWNVDAHAGTDCRFQSVEEAEQAIIGYIDRGIPLMVDWVDWAGHWQVLIGIDTCGTQTPYDDVLIFADPYDVTDHMQDGYYTYPLGRFFSMWREGPCAEKEQPYCQSFVAAWPKEQE